MALTGLDLVWHRVAVPWGPALDHVRDVHVRTGHADPAEELVEELPRLADERIALLVLVEARRLADEHQLRVRVADAEDDLRAPFVETAARAPCDLSREGLELGQLSPRVLGLRWRCGASGLRRWRNSWHPTENRRCASA